MHKVLPSTTSYHKAFTKYFPVLLRATKLAHSTSQYFPVLQSLHKLLPSNTSFCEACTKYFPILLRTTKLAQSTSQYYLVLQSLTSLQCSSSSKQSVSTHAKHNSTASSKKRRSHLELGTIFHCARKNEQESNPKRRRLSPSRARTNFSPQRNLRLPEKTQCFVQILTFKSHPWFMKTKLSCEASFEFQEFKLRKRSSTQLNSIYSAQLYSAQLYSTLVYPTLVNSTHLYLLCSTQLTSIYSAQLNSTQLYSALLNSTRLTSEGTLLNSSLSNSSQLYSSLLCSTLLNSTLLYSTLFDPTLKARADWI